MKTNRLVIAISIAILSACAARMPLIDLNQTPSEQMKKATNIKIYKADEIHPDNFDFKAMVEGHSCKHLTTDPPPSRAEAIMRMKVDAVKNGSSAILDYTCEAFGTDTWGTNCWASITCRGTGVLLPQK
jgi:hypothetical protein